MSLTLHVPDPWSITEGGMSYDGLPAIDRIWVGRDATTGEVIVYGDHPLNGSVFELRTTITANGRKPVDLNELLLDVRNLNLGLNDIDVRTLMDAVMDVCAEATPAPENLGELLASHPDESVQTESRRLGRTAAELLAEVPEKVEFLIPGVLPVGFNCGIAGREKIGKGTWISYLLGDLERAGTSSYIVSEEPAESLREKVGAFGLVRSRIVFGSELKPAAPSWEERVRVIVREAVEDGHGVVFLDNVSRSTGVEDESGVELARRAEMLLDACREAGLTFIGDFHHKKGRSSIEDKFRGGTAVPGSLDVIIDMERVGGRDSRKRRLTSRGRLRANSWVRVVELSEDGTTYRDVGDDADAPTTLGDMLDRYPADSRVTYDRDLLVKMRAATVKAFAEKIDRSENTARRRLNALCDAGLAEKIKGGDTAEGRVPDTYVAADPNTTPNTYEMQAPVEGSSDSRESA